MTLRTFTFSANSTPGDAAAAFMATFANSVYPLSLRITNNMPRDIALPEVPGLYLTAVSDATNRTKVVDIESHDQLARMVGDIEQIIELNRFVDAIVVSDSGVAAPDVPVVFVPMTIAETNRLRAALASGELVTAAESVTGRLEGESAGIEFALMSPDEVATAVEVISPEGNVFASVQPRAGLLNDLLALDGLPGEISCPTDAEAIVQHTGVAGQARAYYPTGGGTHVFDVGSDISFDDAVFPAGLFAGARCIVFTGVDPNTNAGAEWGISLAAGLLQYPRVFEQPPPYAYLGGAFTTVVSAAKNAVSIHLTLVNDTLYPLRLEAADFGDFVVIPPKTSGETHTADVIINHQVSVDPGSGLFILHNGMTVAATSYS